MAERITIRELVVKLLFEGSESGVTKFNSALQAFRTLAGYAQDAARMLADTVGAVTLEIADQADALDEAAGQVGIAAQVYDALAASVQLNGATVGQLDAGLMRLNSSMVEFVQTGKGAGADAFRALLGPDAKKRLSEVESVDQALSMVADGLAALQEPTKQLALAQEILGKSGGKLLPTLKGGSEGLRQQLEAMRQIGTFSPELIAAGGRLNDGLAGLALRARGVKLAFGEEIVPAMAELVEELNAGADALRKLVDPSLRAGARLLADGLRYLRDEVKSLREGSEQWEQRIAALKTALIFLGTIGVSILITHYLPILVYWFAMVGIATLKAAAQMWMAWIKAAIPLVLLAALITAIVLVVEDLTVAVQGGDSAIKRWTDSMIEAGGAGEVFARSVQWLFMGGLGNDLYDLFGDIGAWLDEFGASLNLLPGEMRDAFASAIDWLFGRLGDVRKYFAELFELPDWMRSGLSRAASVATGGLYAPPSAVVGGSGGRTSNVSVGGSSVSVAVNGAGDPRAVGAEVARQVDDAVSRHATRAARDLGAVMQY